MIFIQSVSFFFKLLYLPFHYLFSSLHYAMPCVSYHTVTTRAVKELAVSTSEIDEMRMFTDGYERIPPQPARGPGLVLKPEDTGVQSVKM